MRLLGAHMSIEGGVHRAVERGAEAGCDAIQIFTKSRNQWRSRPLEDREVGLFRERQIEHGVSPAFAHDSYLINLASPDAVLHRRSREALGEEIDRCDRLGLPYLVMHPGAHMGSGEESGLGRIAAAINAALRERPASRTRVLLENTAGMGTVLGHRFEHLRAILDRLEEPDRAGVCLDTCHAFAAGYDMSSEIGYHRVMEEIDRLIGLRRVRAFHLNDSKKGLGCRLDRHEQIGCGALGVAAFWCLLNDPRLDGLPMVLETPKGEDLAEDKINLALLRAQIGSPRPVRGPTVRSRAPRGGRSRGTAGGGQKARSSRPGRGGARRRSEARR